MRLTLKLLPVLLLGSALGGCSMAGTGDYFADQPAYGTHQYTPAYGTTYPSGCLPAPCAPGNSYTVAEGHAAYGQAHHGQHHYGQPVTPHHDAYGRAANPYGQPHGAYVPPAYGANSYGLRGVKTPFKPHAYGSLGLVNYEAGEDLYGTQARLGYHFSKHFAAEVEGSLGVSKDSQDGTFGGVPAEQTIGIDHSLAGFGVLRYPLFGKINGYGRVGYHTTRLDDKIADAAGNVLVDQEFNTDGFAYGSGLELNLTDRMALRLDYTVYDLDGPDADAISLGLRKKF